MEEKEENKEKSKEEEEKLFKELNYEEGGVMSTSSLCMNCEEQGETRLLLTSIPHFREVIISSFRCDNCGHHEQVILLNNFRELSLVVNFKKKE
jgi:zinc finger protein